MRTATLSLIYIPFIVWLFALMPVVVLAQDSPPATEANSDTTINLEIQQELKQLKRVAQQFDSRIHRLELLLNLDRAVRARDETLNRWRTINSNRDTIENSLQKESQLKGLYFKSRADVQSIYGKLNKLRE